MYYFVQKPVMRLQLGGLGKIFLKLPEKQISEETSVENMCHIFDARQLSSL